METVRALVVTEDAPGVNTGGFGEWKGQANTAARHSLTAYSFHLGEYIRVLKTTTWVGFKLEVVRAMRDSQDNVGSLSVADFKIDRHADVYGFRFDQPHTVNGASRTLSDYDMILFFPQVSSEPDPDDATNKAEAAAIATFMESGRGFFATGDHYNLGSKLAGIIPRVRNMRRWWANSASFPKAPSGFDGSRNDTTVAGNDSTVVFEDQSDEFPQQIEPTMYGAGLTVRQGYPATVSVPHPLLCSPLGIVDVLPDHMHEGWCEVPSDLTQMVSTGTTSVREYPDYNGAPLAPEVVALGAVTAGKTTRVVDFADSGGDGTPFPPTNAKQFGVIAAWDGQRVGKGRVAVDSTWHHFFNINLTGDRFFENLSNLPPGDEQKKHGFFVDDVAVPAYEKIQAYYRNIIYWLIPANRTNGIFWASMFELVRNAQLREEMTLRDFTEYKFGHYPYFAQLAESYFKSVQGACSVYKIRRILYKPKIPWYEWIEEIVDPWDPALARRGPSEELAREQFLGVVGLAPSTDAMLKLGMGAAMITAATLRHEKKLDTATIEKHFDQVFDHAVGLYAKNLRAGHAVTAKIEALVNAKR